MGRGMNTRFRRRSYAPRQCTPSWSSHFVSKGEPLVSKGDWPSCTPWNCFSAPLIVGNAPNTALNLHAQGRNGAQRKKQKYHLDFDAEGPTASNNTFFDFGSRLLDRWCSSLLVLFAPVVYSCEEEDLVTCFTC